MKEKQADDAELGLEALDQRGYVLIPQREEEVLDWEDIAAWPED